MTPYQRPAREVLRELDVDPDRGLSGAQVRSRRERHGPNRLATGGGRGPLQILIDQFRSVVILLLLAASAVAAAVDKWLESAAILAALLINVVVGFATEVRAVRAMEALKRLGRPSARVRRDGDEREVPAETLVPGDIVVLGAGDVVPADLRLVEVQDLHCDESTLTGEAEPVGKFEAALDDEPPLAERRNMAYRGTSVTRGEALGVVTATGLDSELGRISELVEQAEQDTTPLERRLDAMGRQLIWLTLALGVAVAAAGIAAGKELLVMVETAIALAIAAVPEGLPVVATVALAAGVRRMARRNALVKRLAAVETLGATGVILTDKTGTLTENQMRVTALWLPDGEATVEWEAAEQPSAIRSGSRTLSPSRHESLKRLLEAVVLCNDAELGPGDDPREASGDPLEVALLSLGAEAGLSRDELLERLPEVREHPFDPALTMMATLHGQEDGYRVAVKGAPEAVLEACTRVAGESEPLDQDTRARWLERNEQMASRGLRVLAIADKQVGERDAELFSELRLLGLVGLLDPPRGDAEQAIAACRRAGVNVVMVTGDHPATARNIAARLGLVEDDDASVVEGPSLPDPATASADERRRLLNTVVFARVSPAQKLDLVDAFQRDGQIVGMTGDGVNDAPALKKAEIGVVMGRRGTEVAREAGDIVLQDDSLTTIVVAIRHGRVIFDNIRRFIVYLLSGNLGEIMAVSAAALMKLPLPLLPLQILFINLLFDVFPALALGVSPGHRQVMEQPPRRADEPLLAAAHWWVIAGYALVIAAAVLAALVGALRILGLDTAQAVTVSFLTFGLARLWHILNMRTPGSGLLVNEVTANPYAWLAMLICALLLTAAFQIPFLARVLALTPLPASGLTLALGCSLVPLLVGQISVQAMGLRGFRERLRSG